MFRLKIEQELTIYGDYCQVICFKKPIYLTEGKEPPPRSDDPEKTDSSLARTRMTLFRLIACNVKKHGNYLPVFLTLTYAENVKDRKRASRDLRLFHMRMSYHVGHSLKYVAIPEYQKRGAIHYHVVYFNMPFTPFEQIQRIWTNGSVDIISLKNIKKIAGYISKYITKDTIDERHKGHRLLITSRGLFRPITIYNNEVDTFLASKYTKTESLMENKDKIIKILYVSNSKSRST